MTAVICCIVIGIVLYACVYEICETILEVHRGASQSTVDTRLQAALDDEADKETYPVFDEVVRTVQELLGGDDDE